MAWGVAVEGYQDVSRAFRKMDKDAAKALRDGLKRAGEPVRVEAESLAVGKIRNIGGDWSRMRLGVTSRYVYIAPKMRNRGGSPRANLALLLMERAMFPAAKTRENEVRQELEGVLDDLAARNGF